MSKNDFELEHGPIWDHVAQVLTGLTDVQLDEIGGYRIIETKHEQTVFDSRYAVPT